MVALLAVIPLILYINQYKMSGDNMLTEIIQMLFLCVVFIGVLGLAYFVTKKIGTINRHVNANKNMQIIEMIPLMQGQYLYIVKVGQGYYLMGCTQKGNITYLKQLEANELNLEEIKSKSFQEYFADIMKGKRELNNEKNKKY